VIGETGSGKSTFCHMITGSDPRINKDTFFVENNANSVT